MATLLAILNNKGGVGKSTLAVHAATWLAERGLRVVLVDADAQASSSEWLARAAPEVRAVRCDTSAHLNKALVGLSTAADVLVADGPAALSAESAVLAAAADLVLLPIGPSMMDVNASYRTARLLHRVRIQVHRSARPHAWVVMNRVQIRTRLAQVARAAAIKYGFPVARGYLGLRQAYAEACGRGTVVWRMSDAGHCAAPEIQRLFEETVGALVARPISTPRTLPAAAVPTIAPRVDSCLPLEAPDISPLPFGAGVGGAVPAGTLAGTVPPTRDELRTAP